MKSTRFLALALLSCLVLTPAVAMGEQQDRTKQNKGNSQNTERRQARFRGMDVNRDGVITRQEWRGNRQAFARHDTNGDGVLSGNEVWANTSADATWQERGERDNALTRTFRRADANGDGILSRNEWASDGGSFTRVDANRDGVITEPEFMGEGWLGWEENASDDAWGEDEWREIQVDTREPRRDSPAFQRGYDRGLTDGRQAGREDKQLRNQWDLEGQRELEEADAGYEGNLGSRADYQAGYRAGFRAGYRQGFGPR